MFERLSLPLAESLAPLLPPMFEAALLLMLCVVQTMFACRDYTDSNW